MVATTPELRDDNVADVLLALRAQRAPLRTLLVDPVADLARAIWLRIEAESDPDRDVRLEALQAVRADLKRPTIALDPGVAEALALTDTLLADSWTRVRVTEARAGRHATRVTLDAPLAHWPAASPGREPFVAVSVGEEERAERAFCQVALGDLHVPVRFLGPDEDAAGALVIVDADWRYPQRAAGLTRFGRPLIVASTSGAHELVAPVAVYDPLVPEMLADGIRAALRFG